jgi:hypothetical protein
MYRWEVIGDENEGDTYGRGVFCNLKADGQTSTRSLYRAQQYRNDNHHRTLIQMEQCQKKQGD